MRYATHAERSAANYLGEDPHDNAPMPLDFYVWVIRNPARTLLVDTGFSADMAVRRGRRYLASPVDLLKQIGIAAESVEDIVVTHMHYDHAGNIAAFPKARLHLQEKEMAYCTGRCMCHAAMRSSFEARDVAQAVERLHAGQLVFHDGDAEIAPGVSLHLIGGHTAGLQVVRVATERAGWCWPAMPRITGTTCAPAGRFPSCSTWAGCWTAIAASRNWRTGRSTSFPGMTGGWRAFRPCAARTGSWRCTGIPSTPRGARKSPRAAAGLRGSVGAWTWERTLMKAIAVAIVGMGPRGLTVLERILEHAHSLPEASRLDIEVFEPGDCGQGVHPAGQSDHLLINTVASQVTMFAPGSVAGGEEGLSLVQWAHLSGYRRHGDRYLRTFEDSGRAITDADHLPRSLLGEYLSWVYRRVVGLLPAHVGVYHHKTRVVDIARHDGGFELALENGARRAADYVFLTTGHGYRKPSAEDRQFLSFVERRKRVNPSLEYYPSPYPIHALAQIPATATVGIQGFGLTAHDVIAALTTGRGGRRRGRGRRPALPALRQSRACCSRATAFRARHQPERTYRPAPGALFHAAGRAVRRQARIAASGDGRLDFQEDVLPRSSRKWPTHRAAATGRDVDAATLVPSQAERDAIEDILWSLRKRQFASLAEFRVFRCAGRADLREAEAGNLGSPVKAATDVLRDTREALRSAVGVRRIDARVAPLLRGRVQRRHQPHFLWSAQASQSRIPAHAAGIIDIAGGPGARLRGRGRRAVPIEARYGERVETSQADVLIVARLDAYSPLTDASPLSDNLLGRGLVRPYLNGGYHPAA